MAVGALAAVVALALPVFGLSLGTSDASTDPAGWTTHQAYATLAQGFGPGSTARSSWPPGRLAGRDRRLRPSPGRRRPDAGRGLGDARGDLAERAGAAGHRLPGDRPAGGPTVDLVNHIRHDLIPQAADGTGLVVHVGGVTATNIDFAHVLTDKLPVFIAVVVILAFILLLVVFRSLLIPLVASVMNLLSVGAGLGALNAVFHWGWGTSVLGLSGSGPVDSFVPVVMFSVLFGLSMDYLVFLVSRIQEEWHQLHHPASRA